MQSIKQKTHSWDPHAYVAVWSLVSKKDQQIEDPGIFLSGNLMPKSMIDMAIQPQFSTNNIRHLDLSPLFSNHEEIAGSSFSQ